MSDPSAKTENDKSPKTHWHRILGRLFELLFTATGVSVNVDFNLMSHPPRSDILLIRVDSPIWTPEQLARLPDGVRDSRANHVLLEFKYTESLNAQRIAKAHAYHTLYQQIQGLSDEQLATFVLSSKTPRKSLLAKYGYQPTKWSGVYRTDKLMVSPVGLLVLNELSNAPHNAYVKCFASRHRAKQSAFKVLTGIEWFPKGMMSFVAGLRRLILPKGEQEMLNIEITPEDVMALGEEWRAALLAESSPEERLMGLKPEERLMGLKPEERLMGLEPYLEEREQQVERQAVLRMIRRTLRVRFKLSAEQLEQYDKPLGQLEVTALDELSEVALTVESLADFEAKLREVLPPDDEAR